LDDQADTPLGRALARYRRGRNDAFVAEAAAWLPGAAYGPELLGFYERALRRTDNPTIAALGLIDRFFLLTHLMRRADALDPWIYARCREVEAAPDGYLDLWARAHFKSTLITFAGTVQDVLIDPEITVGLFSHTRPIAKGFLRQIKREFETNGYLRLLYPDVLWREPKREAPKWSEDDGIVLRRAGNPKEATVEAWGLVDGQPTGKHFRRLVYDDVVTRESVTTPEMIRKVTDAWALSLNLGAKGGTQRYAGTRYHFRDSYGEMIRRGAVAARIHPATANGEADGAPVLLTRDELAEKRRAMGAYTFGCQMLLDPKAGETQGFREEWLNFWPGKSARGLNLYLLCDPASSKKRGSDYTVFEVVGLGADGNYYTVDRVRDRLSLTERADTLFALHRKHRPLGVGYEQYGLQADIEHFKDRMARENYRFPITALGGPVAKEDRIRALIPVFEQGRWFELESCWRMPRAGETGAGDRSAGGEAEDLTRVFIDEEYLAFPVGRHDDMLDCRARILDPALKAVFPGGGSRAAAAAPGQTESGYDLFGR
jgi:phage terminase large subunit-like protein